MVLLEEIEILGEVVEQPQVELGEAAEAQRVGRADRAPDDLCRALPVGAQPEAEAVVAITRLPLNLVARLATAAAGGAADEQVDRRDALAQVGATLAAWRTARRAPRALADLTPSE
uniref:hypothetical protein n=1 Tax=Sphingomonas sp. AR_OL41 TaxID=3042729 RepID=UPI0032AF2711